MRKIEGKIIGWKQKSDGRYKSYKTAALKLRFFFVLLPLQFSKEIFMKNLIKLLVCLLFLLSNYSINAQEQYDAHLVGHVVDEKTGEHLPYVTIQIKGTDIGTITDETGHYFLKNLPIGKQTDIHIYKHYCLEVSAGVKNILDQFQRDLDKGANRDANYIYGPTQARTYFAGVSLKL